MRRERWFAATLVACAVSMAVLAGCGGGAKTEQSGSTSGTEAEAPATEGAEGGAVTGEVSLALGEKIFAERCVLCHGPEGKGDGPGGAALNPKPRNMTDHGYMESRTDDQLYDVIFNGKGSMPAWGKTGILQPNEIRSAIMKVRTFDPAHKG